MTRLLISVWEMTPDEAAVVADRIDQKIFGDLEFAHSDENYDDLLLRACGFKFDDKRSRQSTEAGKCVVCGKEFPRLRVSALYCSPACRAKAARKRPTKP